MKKISLALTGMLLANSVVASVSCPLNMDDLSAWFENPGSLDTPLQWCNIVDVTKTYGGSKMSGNVEWSINSVQKKKETAQFFQKTLNNIKTGYIQTSNNQMHTRETYKQLCSYRTSYAMLYLLQSDYLTITNDKNFIALINNLQTQIDLLFGLETQLNQDIAQLQKDKKKKHRKTMEKNIAKLKEQIEDLQSNIEDNQNDLNHNYSSYLNMMNKALTQNQKVINGLLQEYLS